MFVLIVMLAAALSADAQRVRYVDRNVCSSEAGTVISYMDTLFYEDFENGISCWTNTKGTNSTGFATSNQMCAWIVSYFPDYYGCMTSYSGLSLLETSAYPLNQFANRNDFISTFTSPNIHIYDPSRTTVTFRVYDEGIEDVGFDAYGNLTFDYYDIDYYVNTAIDELELFLINPSNQESSIWGINREGVDYNFTDVDSWQETGVNLTGSTEGDYRLKFKHISEGGAGAGIDNVLVYGPRFITVPAGVATAANGAVIESSETYYRYGCQQEQVVYRWHVQNCEITPSQNVVVAHRNENFCEGQTGGRASFDYATDTLLYEDFENGLPECWSSYTGTNCNGFAARTQMTVRTVQNANQVGPVQPFSGRGSAFEADRATDNGSNAISELVTPAIQLVNPAATQISFAVTMPGLQIIDEYGRATNYYDAGQAAIGSSNAQGAIDQTLWFADAGGFGTWQQLTGTFGEIPSGAYYLHFQHENLGGAGMGIDEVLVYGPYRRVITQELASARAGQTITTYDTVYRGADCMRIIATHWTVQQCSQPTNNRTIHLYHTICQGETGEFLSEPDTLFYEDFETGGTCWSGVTGDHCAGFNITNRMYLRTSNFDGLVIADDYPMWLGTDATVGGLRAAFEADQEIFHEGDQHTPVSQLLSPQIYIADPAMTSISFIVTNQGTGSLEDASMQWYDEVALAYGETPDQHFNTNFLWDIIGPGYGAGWHPVNVSLASMAAGNHYFHFLHGNNGGYGVGLDNILIYGPRRITIPANVSAAAGGTDLETQEQVLRIGCEPTTIVHHWHVNSCERVLERYDTICVGESGYHITAEIDTLFYENFNSGMPSSWQQTNYLGQAGKGLNGSGFNALSSFFVYGDPNLGVEVLGFDGRSLFEYPLGPWPSAVEAAQTSNPASALPYATFLRMPRFPLGDPSRTTMSLNLFASAAEFPDGYGEYAPGAYFNDEIMLQCYNFAADNTTPVNASEFYHFNAIGIETLDESEWLELATSPSDFATMTAGDAQCLFSHVNRGSVGLGIDNILITGPRRILIPSEVSHAQGGTSLTTEQIDAVDGYANTRIITHWYVRNCETVIDRWDTICQGETGYHITREIDTLLYENFNSGMPSCWSFINAQLNGSGFNALHEMSIYGDPAYGTIPAYRTGRSLFEYPYDIWPYEIEAAVGSGNVAVAIPYASRAYTPRFVIADPSRTTMSLALYTDYVETQGDPRWQDGSIFIDEVMLNCYNFGRDNTTHVNNTELFHFNADGYDYYFDENWNQLQSEPNDFLGLTQGGEAQCMFAHMNHGGTGMGIDNVLIMGPRRIDIPAEVSRAAQGDSLITEETVYRVGCYPTRIRTHWYVRIGEPTYHPAPLDTTVCDSLVWRYGIRTASVRGEEVVTGRNHCSGDSILILNLVVGHSANIVLDTQAFCSTLTWEGSTYTTTTTETKHLYSVIGHCDSIVTGIFVRHYGDTIIIDTTICSDQSYYFNGHTLQFDYETVYQENSGYLNNRVGCDSIAYLTLRVFLYYEHEPLFDTITQDLLPYTGYYHISRDNYYYELRDSVIRFTSVHGCDSSYHLNLVIHYNMGACDSTLKYPNLVTPNGDGKNDRFFIQGLERGCWPTNELRIYNRWGILVFKATDLQAEGEGWDPGSQPAGTYFFRFQGRNPYGTTEHNGVIEVVK